MMRKQKYICNLCKQKGKVYECQSKKNMNEHILGLHNDEVITKLMICDDLQL